MTMVPQTEAGGATPPAMVKVWDPLIRIFHWSLVGLFVIAYATGDDYERLHIAVGYAIAGLVLLRLVWGVVGPETARFSSFVRSPRAVAGYVRDVISGTAARYLGHNPAGGLMIVALLGTLVLLSLTGVMMTSPAYWGAKWVEEVHEFLAGLMLGLIGLHVAGVVFSGWQHGENLVRSMITGFKPRKVP